MRFKPIFIILTAIALLGCGELDFDNPNAPTIENAEGIPIQNFVTGAEAGMRVELWIYLRDVAVIGREAYYFEPADPRYTGELMNNRLDPGGFLVTRPWAARYNVIHNTEILLNIKAPQLVGADLADEKAGLEGFAKTIQAYQLLLNLNLQNDNGIQLDYSGTFAAFASKADAFSAIAALLDDANTDLGNGGDAFIFELSDGFDGFNTPGTFAQFNRALAARVAVYRGLYDDALTALQSSFIDEIGNLNLGVYHVYSTGLGDLTNNIFEAPDADVIKLMGHPTFETDADSGDSRFAAKIINRPESTTFDDLASDLGVTVVPSSTSPLPIIRNEELILLRAEANIGLGNFSTAEADINVIRAAAGLADSPTLDATNALDQLLHEKRYSLFLEGHRWIDMRRYNKLGDLPIDRTGDEMITDFPIPETEISG
ncbi:MAG: RagB/SusD family nutrient uptake outer membrane protein [Candidatus Marinimicrobia bacterium]|nr:RagB/SusD family nutrient uptake outer membrane protein [Candidatus Neomarinimicrobiota bacterium]